MVKRYDEPCSSWNDASTGLAPMRLVIAALRRDEPVYEQPRLQPPLPTPKQEHARIAPRDAADEPSPTRGVNIFDMV